MIAAALAASLALAAAAPGAHAAEAGAAPAPAAKAKAGAPARKGSPGKPRAPVRVEAALAPGAAHVTVRLEAEARDVSVRVYGVGGLAVTSAERPVTGAAFAAGEARELDVTFTAPAGRSHLAVQVSGTFASGRRSAVQSFAVGEPTAAQKEEAARGTTRTPTGERIKVLPGQER